ncbi:MAG: hypothetical protein MZV64_49090 [Ignavibacteriales bacterium]|nr:hypothetical protein [Ignavibacteriales bacterium]
MRKALARPLSGDRAVPPCGLQGAHPGQPQRYGGDHAGADRHAGWREPAGARWVRAPTSSRQAGVRWWTVLNTGCLSSTRRWAAVESDGAFPAGASARHVPESPVCCITSPAENANERCAEDPRYDDRGG